MIKKFFSLLMVSTLMACGSDVVINEPNELVNIKTPIKVTSNWNAGIGAADNRRLQKISPFVYGDRIYTVDYNGEANVFTSDGKQLWSEQLSHQTSSIVANDKLFIITTISGVVLAYSIADFDLKWTKKLNTEILVKPLFVEDKVLVRTSTGKISALSQFDGSLQWVYEQQTPVLSSRGSSDMILDNHKVIVGFDNGMLAIINPVNGKAFWEKLVTQTNGQTELDRINDLDGQILVDKGDIYFIGQDNYLSKYKINTAQRVWRVKQNSNTGLSANKNLLFITKKDSLIVAVSKDTGIQVWKQAKLLHRSATIPLPYKDKLIVADLDGYVHVLSSNTGEIIGRTLVDVYGVNSQLVKNKEQIFVQSLGSYLTALSL